MCLQMLEPKAREQPEMELQKRPEDEQSPGASPSEPPTPGSLTLGDLTVQEEACSPPQEETEIPTILLTGEPEAISPAVEGRGGKNEEGGEPEEVKEAGSEDEEGTKEGAKDNGSELADTGAPPSSSSSSFIIPELRLDRSFSADALSSPATDGHGDFGEDEEDEEDEEEEEDDEEEDSDDNYLEDRSGAGRLGGMGEAATIARLGGGSAQGSLRRRTHSEGSLLQEPRTPCFASDNAINCLEVADPAHKAGWTLPSPRTLKRELTKNGGSMHQLCMLFSGRKVSLLLSLASFHA